MNVLEIEKKCTGCSACVDSCYFGALKLESDENGFYSPSLNSDKCVDCGKCVKACPLVNFEAVSGEKECYYGWSVDNSIRETSSSGGVFSVFAEEILSHNGVVFGAEYSEDYKSVKINSTLNTTLESLKTSKYVQSNSEGAYRSMMQELKKGRNVLFTGAPCQIAGAKNVLDECSENLLLVDFLCGGFPSPLCFSQYAEWLESKYSSEIVEINFRDKKKGWSNSGIRVKFKNKKEYFSTPTYDPYYYYYCTPYIKNESCMDCKFKTQRAADITIADFWGFRNLKIPNDEKGMSLIIAHTEKGKAFLNSIREKLVLYPLEYKDASYGFEAKNRTEKELKERESFLSCVRKDGFIAVAKKNYYKNGKIGITFRKIKKRLKNIF